MRARKKLVFLLVLVMCAALTAVYAGGGSQSASGSTTSGPWTPPRDMLFVCGGGIGGGQDMFIRTVMQGLSTSGAYTDHITHENWTGGGGLVCIERVNKTMTGRDNILESGSGSITPIEVGNNTELRQTDLTPVARLVLETMAMVVRKGNTELDTMDKFLAKFKANPESITFGGNLPPGEDYLTVVTICNTLGIDFTKVNYVYFDGSGEVLPSLLGGHIDVTFSGTAEWAAAMQAGQVECIAVAGDERVGGLYKDVPTFKEKGIDFSWVNWRGLLGPREMPQPALEFWRATLKKMVDSPEWQDICAKMMYEPGFMTDGFGEFLDGYEQKCVDALTLAGILQ